MKPCFSRNALQTRPSRQCSSRNRWEGGFASLLGQFFAVPCFSSFSSAEQVILCPYKYAHLVLSLLTRSPLCTPCLLCAKNRHNSSSSSSSLKKKHLSRLVRLCRYLDDKKRKNKLKKQGLWEEVQRRERLDEQHAAAGFDGAERGGGGAAGGSGVSAGRGRKGGGRGGGDGGGGGNNWGVLGRADEDEGSAQLLQKERIR